MLGFNFLDLVDGCFLDELAEIWAKHESQAASPILFLKRFAKSRKINKN
jgi:hypothetical protein